MNPQSRSLRSMTMQPSAFVPLTMSLSALILVLAHAAHYGITHDTDEGAVAHLWQILTAMQLLVVACFAIRWLPRAPRAALKVLALQTGATLANFAAVFWLT